MWYITNFFGLVCYPRVIAGSHPPYRGGNLPPAEVILSGVAVGYAAEESLHPTSAQQHRSCVDSSIPLPLHSE